MAALIRARAGDGQSRRSSKSIINYEVLVIESKGLARDNIT